MNRDELDDLILGHLEGGGDPARLDRALSEDPEAGIRLAELALQEDLLSELGDGRLAEPVPVRSGGWAWIAFAAAAMLVVALLVSLARNERSPAPVVKLPATPAHAPPVRELPAPAPSPAPRKEEPAAVVVKPAKKESPAPPEPVPKPEPEPVVRAPEPPKPSTPPEPAPKSTPDPVVFKPVTLGAVHGAPIRRREGKTEPAVAAMELARTDQLLTTARRAAGFTTSDGCSVWLERNSTIALEQRADGAARVTLSAGIAFFSVDPRTAPFVVATPDGEAAVMGTSFQVERDDRRSVISVLEGAVRFRTEKGEVVVKAGQRSGARAGERPSAPVRADVDAASAWRLRPELSDTRSPYADHEPGSNRKFAGLVLAAPFSDGEAEAGLLARTTAEGMDAGLALGHHYRDLERKVWVNVDRGMEADVRADGTLAPEAFTDRARKATAEYLDHARAAAGIAPRQPVPMIVQFRNHYEADLDLGEVAVAGWNRATMAAAKSFYGQLLDKHRPPARLELRFQGVDDAYEVKGQKRKFLFTEEDARLEGYLAPRNARNGVAFFLPAAFGKRPENIDAYGKILGELIEFLYLRRR